MSTVTPLIRSIDLELVTKLFKKFSAVYGNLWNSRCSTAEEWHDCAGVWLDGLHGFDFDVLRKAVSQAFIAHKDFPPTLGQLVDICLHVSGVPSEHQLIEAMVRKDFNHPLVKAVYDKIGNWALSHGKPEEIKARVRAVYSETLSTYRENPDSAWLALEAFKALPPPEPIPSKIPTQKELIGWRERFEQYKQLAAREKAELKPVDHPVWEKTSVMIGHPDFNPKAHADRKKYLTGMDEALAMTMSLDDQYDRIRFLREDEANRKVEDYRRCIVDPPPKKSPSRSPYGAKTVYKGWMGD